MNVSEMTEADALRHVAAALRDASEAPEGCWDETVLDSLSESELYNLHDYAPGMVADAARGWAAKFDADSPFRADLLDIAIIAENDARGVYGR